MKRFVWTESFRRTRQRLEVWYEDYYRWLLAFALFAVALAGSAILVRGQPKADVLGNWLLTVAVFVVAMATWIVTAPRPADLWIDRNIRKAEADLIFFLVDHTRQGRLPRDVLLHYELALANVGGRKTVLSDLTLDWFVDDESRPIKPYGFNLPLPGQMVRATFVWRDHRDPVSGSVWLESYGEREQQPLPVVLEPDDAIVIRFRTRTGIDWSQRWIGSGGLEPVKEFYASLELPIRQARITATFRRGRSITSKSFRLPVTVAQQNEYKLQLSSVTMGFARFPEVEVQQFPRE